MIGWIRTVIFILLVGMWAFDPYIRGTPHWTGVMSLVDFIIKLILWVGMSVQFIMAELSPYDLDDFFGTRKEEKEDK